MGKFNYDKGLQPRTLDNYPFDRYGIDGRTIPITFNETSDYLPIIKKSINVSGTSSKYVPPNRQSLNEESLPKKDFELDINDLNEFPKLG